jgi:hypothetical protein
MYHNLTHTLDTYLAAIRLIDGYNITEGKLPIELTINLLIAALFHDTGYIQEEWDKDGTGAKYTESHIERSIVLLINIHKEFDISPEAVKIISKLIRCTRVNLTPESISFTSKEEKTAGYILGTSDILGQMSDREYLEKLLFLYYEFREAGIPGYETEFDIIRKTLDYYKIAKKNLAVIFDSVYNYAKLHFLKRLDINKNLYIESINKNILYIKKIIEDKSTNFRFKLKRGNVFKILKDKFNKNVS